VAACRRTFRIRNEGVGFGRIRMDRRRLSSTSSVGSGISSISGLSAITAPASPPEEENAFLRSKILDVTRKYKRLAEAYKKIKYKTDSETTCLASENKETLTDSKESMLALERVRFSGDFLSFFQVAGRREEKT